MKLKIKKGDKVQVLSGASKGTQGEVLRVFPKTGKAIVEGVNVAKKHMKPSAQNPQGEIRETELPIYISKLAIVDPESGKPSRVGYKMEDGAKVRISKKSGKTI